MVDYRAAGQLDEVGPAAGEERLLAQRDTTQTTLRRAVRVVEQLLGPRADAAAVLAGVTRNTRLGNHQVADHQRFAGGRLPTGWNPLHPPQNFMAEDGLARRRAIEAMQIRTTDATQHSAQHQL